MGRRRAKFVKHGGVNWFSVKDRTYYLQIDPRMDNVNRVRVGRFLGQKNHWDIKMVLGEDADRLAAMVHLGWSGDDLENAKLLWHLYKEAAPIHDKRVNMKKSARTKRYEEAIGATDSDEAG